MICIRLFDKSIGSISFLSSMELTTFSEVGIDIGNGENILVCVYL
jgi:hypothetical protein